MSSKEYWKTSWRTKATRWRATALQHHQKRHAHGVVERHPLVRSHLLRHRHQRLGQPRTDVCLVPRVRGAQLVQAEAADHHHEPAAQVVDLLEINLQHAGECLLDDVLGIADAAQHPVCDVEEVTTMLAPRLADGSLGGGTASPRFTLISSACGCPLQGRDSPGKCDITAGDPWDVTSACTVSSLLVNPFTRGDDDMQPAFNQQGEIAAIEVRDLRKTYPGGVEAVKGMTSTSPPARCSGCSAPTAPASRPPSACSPPPSPDGRHRPGRRVRRGDRPLAARRRARSCSRRRSSTARSPGGATSRSTPGCGASTRSPGGRASARSPRPFGLADIIDRPVGTLQRRPAPPPGDRPRAGLPAAGAVPRRADRRARPAHPLRAARHDRRAPRARRR